MEIKYHISLDESIWMKTEERIVNGTELAQRTCFKWADTGEKVFSL